MAIFLYVEEIAGDAKEKFSGNTNPDYWYIRADSLTFGMDPAAADDSESTGTTTGQGAQQPGGGGGGGGAANARLGSRTTRGNARTNNISSKGDTIEITKKMDYSSSYFADAVANRSDGTHNEPRLFSKGATLYVTTSQREVMLKITIPEFIVESYSVTIESSGDSFSSTETINLKFNGIKWTYNETDSKGTISYTSDFDWAAEGEAPP